MQHLVELYVNKRNFKFTQFVRSTNSAVSSSKFASIHCLSQNKRSILLGFESNSTDLNANYIPVLIFLYHF